MIFTYANDPGADDTPIRPALIVPWWEILAVMTAMLGVGSIFGAWFGLTHPPETFYLLFSDHFFLVDGVFKGIFLTFFIVYLHRRGWRPGDFGVRFGLVTTLRGLELLVFTYGGFLAVAEISHFIVWILAPTPHGWVANLFIPHGPSIPLGGVHLSWLVLIAVTVLNAFYEELVYMGYGFNLFAAKYGPRAAVLLTVLARLVVHAYQGTEHLLPLAAWAVIFGLWYRYHRAVWPLILAHLIVDLITFGLLKVLHGAP
jgi:membrane protease YdiL (CAAX protease family)